MPKPALSICIPTTYKRARIITRVLDSILSQTFQDYEVCISDNSPKGEDGILDVTLEYGNRMDIVYQRTYFKVSMGRNWNNALEMGTGEWINFICDDDWYNTDNALEIMMSHRYYSKFIFFHNQEVDFNTRKLVGKRPLPQSIFSKVNIKKPYTLFANHTVGGVMIHRSIYERFNERLTWWLDTDFAIRVMEKYGYYQIKDILINFGVSDFHSSASIKSNPDVLFPLSMVMYKIHGDKLHQFFWGYNKFWRILYLATSKGISTLDSPDFIQRMIKVQKRVPNFILNNRFASIAASLISYIFK